MVMTAIAVCLSLETGKTTSQTITDLTYQFLLNLMQRYTFFLVYEVKLTWKKNNVTRGKISIRLIIIMEDATKKKKRESYNIDLFYLDLSP